MQTVSFTRMKDGTREDYQFLQRMELDYISRLPERLLAELERLRESFGGYRVTRYEHSLQAATRAARTGESEEYVVATLFHDIGDRLAPDRHAEMAAAVLEPYVSGEIAWIVRHHGLFQAYYYAHHFGEDRNARDKYAAHPYYAACARFCEKYDQASFDPGYPSEQVSFFEPMVRRVISLRQRQAPGW